MMLNLFIAGLTAAAQPAPADGAIEVLGAHFYAQDNRQPDAPPIETTQIPHRPGTSCYGWVLEVPRQNRSVAIRELFELPAPARQWVTDDPSRSSVVAPNQAAAATELQADLSEGLITHAWCVAEGDPEGPHRIRVYQGETLLREFRFTVVPDTH
jgi:hypothetical protein